MPTQASLRLCNALLRQGEKLGYISRHRKHPTPKGWLPMSDFDLVPIVTSPKSAVQVHPKDQATYRQDQETPMPIRQIDQESNRQHGSGHRAGRNEPRHPECLFAEREHESCSWFRGQEHSAVRGWPLPKRGNSNARGSPSPSVGSQPPDGAGSVHGRRPDRDPFPGRWPLRAVRESRRPGKWTSGHSHRRRPHESRRRSPQTEPPGYPVLPARSRSPASTGQ